MSFGNFNHKTTHNPVAEINMVPLIDVMLVLLVIFMVTAPLLSHSINLELPKVSSQPNSEVKEKINIAIDANGRFFWNNEEIDRQTAQARFITAAKQEMQAELHIHADEQVEYRYVAQILGDATNAGLTKVGFITLPDKPS